ncbi:MAG: efflux RND transporter periplasmic adaptor subunit [Clostridiales bacterium]|jgi:multidrug resistance efflux pump|nr:efflux RND transporter periplasmic adaptor subunit [Clostridiales bacterium]
MKKTKVITLTVLAAILIGGGYFGYTFWVDVSDYFTTNNASVTANMISITPMVSGSVAAWDVKEGDRVTAGQILGRQDLGDLVQSTSINTQTLETSAGANISKADIKTPINGKVVQSNVVVGETVAPGMQVAMVADTNNMYVKANVEETDINRIQMGQKATVTIDAYPGIVFTGHVESIGEATQDAFSTTASINTSGTYTKVTQLIPVKINVAGIDGYNLRLGYNATVKIKTK